MFSLSVLGPPSGLRLCRLRVCCHGLCELTDASSCSVWKALSLESPITLTLILFPSPLPHRSLNLEGRHLMKITRVKLSPPKPPLLCMFGQLGVSVLIYHVTEYRDLIGCPALSCSTTDQPAFMVLECTLHATGEER